MKMSKIVALVCVLGILMTVFAGCSPAEVSQTSQNSESKGSNVSDESTVSDDYDNFEEKVKFSWAWFAQEFGEDDLYDYIAEKFNVEIEFVPLSWNERKEQVNIMVASGDMPNVLFYEEDKGQYLNWAKTGAIRALPEIDDRFPNLKHLKDQMTIAVKQLEIDGTLYAWPKFNGANKFNTLDVISYIYRKDWADKLGITKDEYTFEEFLEVARRFVNDDPGGNGSGRTIGIADQDFAAPSFLGAFNVYANPIGYKKIDGKYVWGAAMPETITGIKKVKEIYDEGLYWKDFYTGKGYDAFALFVSGRVGIYYDNFVIKNLNDIRNGFKQANPDIDVYDATAIMKVKGPDGKYWSREFGNHWSTNIYSPTTDDKTMKRILAVQDWLAGEEGSNMCWFGMENKDWAMKDGEVELKWEKDSDGNLVRPSYATSVIRTMALLNEDFDYSNPLMPKKTIQDVTDWILLRTEENTNIHKVDIDLLEVTGPNYLENGAFYLEMQDQLKKLIASSKDIEKDYTQWLKTMEPKVNLVLDELNK